MTAHRLCPLADIGDGEARRFDVDGRPIAVVRIGDEAFAIGDVCSHADVSLSEGEVDPYLCTLECWKHGSAFDLRTGEPQSLPATKPVPAFETRVVDGEVEVTIT